MHKLSILVIFTSFLLLTSCSTAKLSTQGNHVEVVNEKPGRGCKNLGPVFGKGGGQFGGGLISDENLMEYASNDLRNKAAAKGATHVLMKSHQMGQSGGEFSATTTATFSGIAYKCNSRPDF